MLIDLRLFRHAPTLRLVAGLALGLACRGVAQTALPKDSPFLPPANTTATPAAPVGGMEFAAVFGEGKKTYIALFDPQLKKSRWIPVGGSADGIAVLNYDAVRNQVVVRINGAEKILTLRKERGTIAGPASPTPAALSYTAPAPTPPPAFVSATVTAPVTTPTITPALAATPASTPAGASGNTSQWAVAGFSIPPPMPISAYQTPPTSATTATTAGTPPAVPAASAPAPDTKPATPATSISIAKQEEEARMLVSDLLEIGMAQRKAYEEAQKKANEQQAQTGKPSGG